tara:strand:+ start:137 stop:625 length:489 start_codon:yes stop_codon:yes gene_type:complete
MNDFSGRIKAALNKIGDYYVSELKNRLLRDGNKASSDLIDSIYHKVVSDGIEITANRYLGAISEGKNPSAKGPSPEMVSSVARWMKYKGIKPRNLKGGLTASKYKRAAFGIAKTINRDGWQGSKVISRSFKGIETQIDKELTEAFKLTLDELITDINNKTEK